MRVLLNVGCGATRPAGWINTDNSLNALLQTNAVGRAISRRFIGSVEYQAANTVFMDLNRRWQYDTGGVDVVYASHVYEHLTLRTGRLFMSEAFRVLRPGGVIRIVVPDLYTLASRYVAAVDRGDADASREFLYAVNLHLENSAPERRSLRKLIHWVQGYPHQHKYMYDRLSIAKILTAAGFVGVRTAAYGESEYVAEIHDVECTAEGIPAIYLEALKPDRS